MPVKQLDRKLKRIKSGHYSPAEFIIADAKDADMGFGVLAPGYDALGKLKTKADYLRAIEAMNQSGLVDVMLMSASTAETLGNRQLFENSPVTPAVRMNDTSDIWLARGSQYREFASRPFASTYPEAIQSYSDLGLYSMTFSNQLEGDLESLQCYRRFRRDTSDTKLRHFLEVFNPAFDIGIAASELGHYINDMIVKALAGVTSSDMPLFLKIQFNGIACMQELSNYDPENLTVGILGGAKGTTRDTFELLHQAEQSGARVALFGRKINLSEAPLELVRLMREVITCKVTPDQAVSLYHEFLQAEQITPQRTLNEDRQVTDKALMN